MKAVILDAKTLGNDIDLGPIRKVVDDLVVFQDTMPDQLMKHLADADLILTNKVEIPGAAMDSRKAVLVLATGTNNIDLAAAKAKSVPILNVNDYGTQSVAQHAMMLILALAAKLPLYQRDVLNGEWQQSPSFCLMEHPTVELAGKTLVIVGAGNLGSAVATLAGAFGMKVIFSARPGNKDDARPSLDSLLGEADVLSFHCPLTSYTRHLLNSQRLAAIKPGCLVVNCARGGIIDESAALAALRAGIIGGLAVDVLPVEPPVEGHPLLEALPEGLNLVVTPHSAWISREARQKIIDITAEHIAELVEQST